VFSLVESCSLFSYVVLSAVAGIFAQCPLDIGCCWAICRYDKVVKAEQQFSTITEDCFSAFIVSLFLKLNFFKSRFIRIGIFFVGLNPDATTVSFVCFIKILVRFCKVYPFI
jgi:hypothetical protein